MAERSSKRSKQKIGEEPREVKAVRQDRRKRRGRQREDRQGVGEIPCHVSSNIETMLQDWRSPLSPHGTEFPFQ